MISFLDDSEMIAIHSLTAVLAAEALIVLSGLLLWLLLRGKRRERRERGQARAWVRRFKAHEKDRRESLGEELAGMDAIVDEASLGETLAEVKEREQMLYCVIIDAFLTHDVDKLSAVEEQVGGLSEPWRLLARRLSAAAAGEDPRERLAAMDADLRQARAEAENAAKELERARIEREDLAQRLDRAIVALDQVSGEYAKMFNDPKSAEELRASRARLLQALRAAERSLGASVDAARSVAGESA
jgi:DNA repair exonuclease SbcCD ATPase subunit